MSGLWRQLPVCSPVSLATVYGAVRGISREPVALRTEIEGLLCKAYAARDALLVGSGTAALRLALEGVRATRGGGLVALPGYGCYDMASAAVGADARVVLYDVDPSTLGPEPSSLRKALEREPTAVVGAHLYGNPVDMNQLASLSAETDGLLIEDAAQEAGGRLNGTPLGSFGSLTVLSFGRGKGTTAGAGGALLARDDAGARVVSWARSRVPPPARGAREALQLAFQWALGRPRAYWLPASVPFLHLGETVYREPRDPTAMTRVAQAALTVSWRDRDAEAARRRATANRLREWSRRSTRVRTIEPIRGAIPGDLRLPVLAIGCAVDGVVQQLGRHGVAAAYPAPLASLEPLRSRAVNASEDLAGAHALAEGLLTFPTHGLLGPRDVQALKTWLEDV